MALAVVGAFFASIVMACGTEGSGGSEGGVKPRVDATEKRQRLLATCPAEAQGFFAWQQGLAEERGLSRPVHEGDVAFDPVAVTAEDYLATLPPDQRAGVAIDSVRKRVIVQVTRGRSGVLADLRARVRDPETVTVETVRWSTRELEEFAGRIDSIPGSGAWGYGYDGPDGVIKVDVPGDPDKARRRISEVVDPCAFKVKGNVESMVPQERAEDPATRRRR